MAIRKHTNNYSSTLNGAITDVATTLIVDSAAGLPSIGAGEEYNLTLDNGAGTIEIVTVTDDASSPTLTVTRGVEGTTAVAWSDEATIELRATADSVDRKQDELSGATLTAATVATGDKVLIQDADDSDILKTATAQSIANLAVTELSTDTSPQLGGNLDLNGNNIGGATSYFFGFSGGIPRIQGANTNYYMSMENSGLYMQAGTTWHRIDFTNSNKLRVYTNNAIRMEVNDSGMRLGGSGAYATTILDEDTMSSDSATALATQQSIKAYVDANAGSGGFVGFHAYNAASQNISPLTFTKINHDTEILDPQSDYDSATNYRYTPSQAGKYFVYINGGVSLAADQTQFLISIYKNGSIVARSSLFSSGNSGYGFVGLVVDMNGSSDYLEGYIYHTDTVSRSTWSGISDVSFFGAYKIGD